YGYVRRPRVGVAVQTVTAVDAEVYKLPEVRGAEVSTVEKGTPAERAGLRVGDVIMAVDGEPIQDSPDLTSTLARRKPGDRVVLTICRDGKELEVPITLGEFERTEQRSQRSADTDRPEQVMGFSVTPMTPQIAAELGYETGQTGPVISSVQPGSP